MATKENYQSIQTIKVQLYCFPRVAFLTIVDQTKITNLTYCLTQVSATYGSNLWALAKTCVHRGNAIFFTIF